MSEEIDNIKKILDNSSYFYKKDNIYVDKRTEDYAVNFGLQWNKFALTQYDSFTGLPLTRNRLINSSEWKDEEINKKLIEMKEVLNLDEPPGIEKKCEKCAYLSGGKNFFK